MSWTLGNLKKIELSWLKKEGLLGGFRNSTITWTYPSGDTSRIRIVTSPYEEDPHVRLRYKIIGGLNGEDKSVDYRINMYSLPCHFGGKRWMFTCPLYRSGKYCGRSCRVLYSAGDYYGCRKCAGLMYDSQTMGSNYRTGHWGVLLADMYEKNNVKRKFYNGRPTKKYKTYLNKLRRTGLLNQEDWGILNNTI